MSNGSGTTYQVVINGEVIRSCKNESVAIVAAKKITDGDVTVRMRVVSDTHNSATTTVWPVVGQTSAN